MSIYQDNGFKNRKEYLESLALDYDPEYVFTVAEILGEEEDFDGLLEILEEC